MPKFRKLLSFLLVSFLFSLNVSAQFGPQFENRGFENWTTRETESVSEPVHWHSTGTATGTFASWLPSDPQIESSTQVRPGSTGTKSLRIIPRSVLGITANGTVTNGRINAGSMSATGSGNYNYTQRSQNAFNTPITQCPDSLTVWVCFRSQSTSHKAQVKAVVHGDADYQLIANGEESPSNMRVATADQRFTRTATNGGAYNWTRLSIPFINNGPCTDVRYILLMATTNENPGTGSTNDDLFVDDVLLVYTPTLSMGTLSNTQLQVNASITIPFTLSGTMSPENLNGSANQVIAQLSDANGNFNNPTELGRATTNNSGSITAQIPNVSAGNGYRIRVISTNYPLVGGNIQNVSIMPSTYTITATANPNDGGTVSGGGEYNQGASCTVSATAATGYTFVNWTENGNQVSTDANYTFTVNSNRNLVANFQIQSYNITATADPTAGGNVTGANTYNYGQSCTLTATPNTGYTFVNWTKNGTQVSTNASYTFTVTESAAYVAHFNINSYTVSVSANPSNGGTVTGGGTYTYGQNCTVTATASSGHVFINWTENGNIVSTSVNYTFAVTNNHNLVANFATDAVTITAIAEPSEGGTIEGAGDYLYGTSCTLEAIAKDGYAFMEWTKDGVQVSTEAVFTFTVTASETYVAHFQDVNTLEMSLTTSQIYPNPFSSSVNISAEKAIKNIRVYDVYGRLMKEETVSLTQFNLDLNEFSAGIYLLQVNYGDSQSTHRIMKAE